MGSNASKGQTVTENEVPDLRFGEIRKMPIRKIALYVKGDSRPSQAFIEFHQGIQRHDIPTGGAQGAVDLNRLQTILDPGMIPGFKF